MASAAYRAGIKAIGLLAEKDPDGVFFPKTLLIEMLKREPYEYLYIDNVQLAAAWKIDVFGFAKIDRVNRGMLEAACLNEARHEELRLMRRWWGAGNLPTGQRERISEAGRYYNIEIKGGWHREVIKEFGEEDAFVCVVDVYKMKDGTLELDISFVDGQSDKKMPRRRSAANVEEFGGRTSIWYTADRKHAII